MSQAVLDDQGRKVLKWPKKPLQVATLPRLMVDANGVAAMLNVSRSKVYSMRSTGDLGPMPLPVGGCLRWSVEELTAWVQAGCPHRQQWTKLWTIMTTQNKQILD